MSSRLCTVSATPPDPLGGSGSFLSCQYYDVSRGESLSAEQRLVLALLTDAINVYQKGALSRRSPARRLYVDAERWILAERSAGDAFSFGTVCDALGINSVLLRRRIISWKHTLHRYHAEDRLAHLQLKITPRERYARSHSRTVAPSS